MKQIYYTKKSGFSLVESMIAVFIFSLLSVMLSGAFSSFLKNFSTAKKVQRNAESAQYAINLMAKTIRTSTLTAAVTDAAQINMLDNSTGKCVVYKYDIDKIKIATKDGTTITDCENVTTSFLTLTDIGQIKEVSFSGIPSVDGSSYGKVLISVDVDGNDASRIQTSVSLRQ